MIHENYDNTMSADGVIQLNENFPLEEPAPIIITPICLYIHEDHVSSTHSLITLDCVMSML